MKQKLLALLIIFSQSKAEIPFDMEAFTTVTAFYVTGVGLSLAAIKGYEKGCKIYRAIKVTNAIKKNIVRENSSSRIDFAGFEKLMEEFKAQLRGSLSQDDNLKSSPIFFVLSGKGCGKTTFVRKAAQDLQLPLYRLDVAALCHSLNDSLSEAEIVKLAELALKEVCQNAGPAILFIDGISDIWGSYSDRPQLALFARTLEAQLRKLETLPVAVVMASRDVGAISEHMQEVASYCKFVLKDPSLVSRKNILKHALMGSDIVWRVDEIDIEALAVLTNGYSACRIISLVNKVNAQASCCEKQRDTTDILRVWTGRDILKAWMEEEYGSGVMDKFDTIQNAILAAYRAAGKALLHILQKESCFPFAGLSLVHGVFEVRTSYLRDFGQAALRADIAYELAGRAAEELVFGSADKSPLRDIDRSLDTARVLVLQTRMDQEAMPFKEGKNVATEIEDCFLQQGYEGAKQILTLHRSELDALAHALMESKYLTSKEVYELLSVSVAQ